MIYVDDAGVLWPDGPEHLAGERWFHLTADSEEELHEFAERLGMRREWFQGSKRPHYDIHTPMRALALELGAVPISSRETILKLRACKALNNMQQ